MFPTKVNILTRLRAFVCLSLLYIIGVSSVHAQYHSSHAAKAQLIGHTTLLKNKTLAKLDSLSMLYRIAPSQADTASDELTNPYYFPIMGSPALYSTVLQRLFVLPADSAKGDAEWNYTSSLIDKTLADACLRYPNFALNVDDKNAHPLDEKDFKPRLPQQKLPAPSLRSDEVTPIPMGNDNDWNLVVRKPNFWTFKTNFALQFTQNYVSDNWYKGGESHNALLASTVIEANYNNQRKLTFDNKLEMKLGFQTSHNDDEHKYKTNSDLIRLTNKLGLRAVKHWYYTVMLQSWTQFYRGYKANDPKVYSDFMSPFESLLSVGMDYQFNTKSNKFRISATLSPIALKLKYVDRPSLITSFGLDEGKHSKWEYGSNVTINYTWDIVKNVKWTGRIYYFTDYSSTQVEWENTFNLSINRYLSARLFLYPRFDDSRNRSENQSNFEFNELLSLGLNVNF